VSISNAMIEATVKKWRRATSDREQVRTPRFGRPGR
jgi:hypothetical protein